MKNTAPKTEKNKRVCAVCGDVFYAFPSQDVVSCKNKLCRSTIRSRSMTRHGMLRERLYRTWRSMKYRCKYRDGYKNLTIHPDWKKFEQFYEWALKSGYSDELEIDRKDNNLGYSPDNCRWATRQQQTWNRTSNRGSTSKYKGVSLNRRSRSNPWRAVISINGKCKQLGCFQTEEEAARAYDAAAKELHGDFACLNFKEK